MAIKTRSNYDEDVILSDIELANLNSEWESFREEQREEAEMLAKEQEKELARLIRVRFTHEKPNATRHDIAGRVLEDRLNRTKIVRLDRGWYGPLPADGEERQVLVMHEDQVRGPATRRSLRSAVSAVATQRKLVRRAIRSLSQVLGLQRARN